VLTEKNLEQLTVLVNQRMKKIVTVMEVPVKYQHTKESNQM
jgi:hypothetical protein